jgi:aconitase A
VPLQFQTGTTRKSLQLDGSEIYDVNGLEARLTPRCTLTLDITRKNGTHTAVPVTCRLDTDEEIAYFRAGGLLPIMCERVLQQI